MLRARYRRTRTAEGWGTALDEPFGPAQGRSKVNKDNDKAGRLHDFCHESTLSVNQR
jgi:hypothetical protein